MSKGDSRVMNDTNRRPLQLAKLSTTDSYARMKEQNQNQRAEECVRMCVVSSRYYYTSRSSIIFQKTHTVKLQLHSSCIKKLSSCSSPHQHGNNTAGTICVHILYMYMCVRMCVYVKAKESEP